MVVPTLAGTCRVVATLSAVALFNGLPYLEELWQDIRANGLRPRPEPQPYRVLDPVYPKIQHA